ncbi:hypothetical protein A359_01910 [secondary endosymbiont of Ctenarytaina eucalypti]|uniref:Uncharacterized protein n=1 Tax=secondary endosymbiont of Ctenarytaina eucalypti TaxID=1199245 RepID=J3TF14_9ENTR|nr:hypothetical protein A359_01910 [secondary endosymbiont of Ctenarytaina eucalypti]
MFFGEDRLGLMPNIPCHLAPSYQPLADMSIFLRLL